MLDWDDLRYFLAVARAGSLSAAARQLRVAQTTVGRRIAGFEARLGARLFVPKPSGQALSATGARLLAHAEQMERDALAAERVASGRDAGLAGPVRITATEWMVRSVLGPLLAPLSSAHPALELELLADPRHLNLARRDADIAIRASAFEEKEIVQRPLAKIGFGLYASDAYLVRFGAPDFARRCAGHVLIGMSSALVKVPDVEWLPEIAGQARVAIRTNGREPMATMAAAGIGMACLPRFIGDATPGLRLLPAPPPAPERQLYLGVHRDARAVPRVKASASFLLENVRQLQGALLPA